MQPCYKTRLIMGFFWRRFANRSNWLQSKDRALLQAVVPQEGSKAHARSMNLWFTLAIFVTDSSQRSQMLHPPPDGSLEVCEPLASFSLSPQSPPWDLVTALLQQPIKQGSGLINKRITSADETSGLECDFFIAEGTGRAAEDHQSSETFSTVSVGDSITIPPVVSFGVMCWPLTSVNTVIQ